MRTYRVKIDLMRDGMGVDVWALSFADKNGGYRLTRSKATGSWTVVRSFECEFDQRQLDRYDHARAKKE